jgi:APA family basic amino acid/polyamine antiporter
MKSFIGSPASIATVAAGFCRFLSVFLPKLNHPVLRWQVSLPHSNPHQLVLTVAQLLAAGLIVSVTFINYLGVRLGGRVQITFTSMKVAALVAIIIAALSAHSHLVSDSSTVITPAGFGVFGAFLTALVPVMWAYNGWSDLAQVGGEIADPQRNVPRALIGGVVAVAALYVMANVAYFHVLSVRQIASSTHVASDVVAAFSGARAARWITVAMMLSAFGTLNENLLALPRVPYAMASDGIFFHFCGQVSERFRTPWGGLLFTGLTAALLALTGTYEELYSLVIFALWIFHALTAVALIRLRQTEPELERPYRTLGYPAVPILFCAVGTIFTVNLWMVRPVRSSIGALAILSGLLFYRSWQKQNVNEVKNQLA